MKFLVNPRGKRKAAKRSRRATPRRGPGGRFLKRKKKASSTVARRKSRRGKRRAAVRRRSTARRRVVRIGKRRYRRSRKALVARRSKTGRRVVRRVRTYKRNPGFVTAAMRGLKDAAAVTAGKVGYNLLVDKVGAMLPLPIAGIAGSALKGLIVAGVGSFAVGKVLRGDTARFAIAGMYAGLLESLIRGANVPVIGGALGEYNAADGLYNSMGAYPPVVALPAAGMGAYANSNEFEDESAYVN